MGGEEEMARGELIKVETDDAGGIGLNHDPGLVSNFTKRP